MYTEKAIRSLKAAIEMLDSAAGNIPIDDPMRRRVISKRQDVEDLLDEVTAVKS